MNCPWCGIKADLKTNEDFRRTHLKEFGVKIPEVEIWTCMGCSKGVGYADGVLMFAGGSWIPFDEVKVPEGCLAVFDKGSL